MSSMIVRMCIISKVYFPNANIQQDFVCHQLFQCKWCLY